MKKILVTLTIALGLLYSGCNDWLYLEPEDGVIRQDFWQTKEDVHAAVFGTYCSLLGNTDGNYYSIPECIFTWGEIRADMVGLGSRARAVYSYVKTGDLLPDNRLFHWGAFYRTINNCNTVLEFADDVTAIDSSFSTEMLNEYKAEVLTLRALMYFYLYRSFGDVPLKLTASVNDDESFTIRKTSKDSILNHVITDLEYAFNDAVYTFGDDISDKGRVTKYTIAAILADAYLWKEDYASALDYCNFITNSGKFTLVPRDQNWFTTLYSDGNSVEGIFELQFERDKLNPFYSLYKDNRYLRAAPERMEEYFPLDPLADPDSADVRADGCSYKTSDNYSFWKYIGLNEEESRSRDQSYANYIVYRYSEILLFKAEALNHLGNSQEAMKLINIIRRRAHAQRTTDFIGDETNFDDVNAYILEERTRELAFEGKRWYDVLRFAKKDDYKRLSIIINMITRSAPPEKIQTMTNKYRDKRFHYFPIYISELEANPKLEQNSYFEGL